ncbi:MAG: hypothetical protein AB1422_17835 [bacterium]
MITSSIPQIDTRPRHERRPEIIALEKRKRKLVRKLRPVNLQVEFDNDTGVAILKRQEIYYISYGYVKKSNKKVPSGYRYKVATLISLSEIVYFQLSLCSLCLL